MEDFLKSLHPYLAGLLIGFLIGLERERAHHPGSQALGVRTFSFLGLLGAVAGVIESEIISALIATFVFAGILMGYLRSTRNSSNDFGFTTEAAGAVVFCLAYISVTDQVTAFMLGALTLLLLVGRKALHNFTREKITQAEAEAFVTLIVLGVAILPFLSKEPLDPWGVFVPFRLGTLVFLLALVQFSSYALLKIFGEKVGTPLAGFLAGMASSTAAFVNIREKMNKESSFRWDLLGYGMMAIVASMLQSVVIIFATSPQLGKQLLWSFIGVFVVCLTLSIVGFFRSGDSPVAAPTDDSGPLNLKKQLAFASVLFLVMALANLAKQYLGATAFLTVSFVSGLFELQGMTFAIASMEYSPSLIWAMVLAFIASLISKSFIVLSAPHSRWTARGLWIGALALVAVTFIGPLLFV